MESRLPKLNFQFKVPARIATGCGTTTTSSVKSVSASNLTSASNDTEAVNKTKDSQSASKSMITSTVTSKTADENKAPLNRVNKTVLSNTNITTTRGTQKRPGITNNTLEPKRANLKTSMKAVARPIRPNTTAGTLPNLKPAATSSKSAPAAKPNKWDFKGRLEYANNELSTLKQKHREVTAQYNNVQEEIINLRELASSASALSNEVKILKTKLDELQKERDSLAKELQEIKILYEEASISLEQHKADLSIKTILLTEKENEVTDLKTQLNGQLERNTELTALVLDMDRKTRALHNYVQELKGNIRVFCRVRPKIPKEASKSTCVINYLDECTLEVGKPDGDLSNGKLKAQRQEFSFDKVFPPSTSQSDVFEELSMLVQSALEGYNVCVFAYGQTGSGKTYTMEGFPDTEDKGMIPRTVEHIFKEMKHFELLGWEYKIEASFLEIYNEQIVDLLDYTRKSHEIRMTDSKGSDLYVTNLLVQEINSPEELHQCLMIARENRAMAATQSNERSSRSHSVARIRLIGTHKTKQEVSIGNLNLVDLAGSERLKNEEAARIAETKNINKSLANLGHVILALLQKQDHIPYRNSKLTHLLMPSLGGNSKTLMLLNISPLEESLNETLNSLRFGSNVNSCKTGTIKKVRTVL